MVSIKKLLQVFLVILGWIYEIRKLEFVLILSLDFDVFSKLKFLLV